MARSGAQSADECSACCGHGRRAPISTRLPEKLHDQAPHRCACDSFPRLGVADPRIPAGSRGGSSGRPDIATLVLLRSRTRALAVRADVPRWMESASARRAPIATGTGGFLCVVTGASSVGSPENGEYASGAMQGHLCRHWQAHSAAAGPRLSWRSADSCRG